MLGLTPGSQQQPTWEIDDAGWCAGARRSESANCDARPPDARAELLVVHSISLPPGEFGGDSIERLFSNSLDFSVHPGFAELRGLRVSSHFLIRRDGALVQFVSCDARAWHAGVSEFEGRVACNDFSIGIELEGTDRDPFADAQYASLVRITRALYARYPLTAVAAHSEIAPSRKTDPGPGFLWSRFLDECALPLRRARNTAN